MAKGDLTAEQLRDQFDYNPLTGELIRKPCQRLKYERFVSAGRDVKGYLRASVNGHQYRVHRLVWLHYYGEWPKYTVDHINRKRDDNRIENLRDVPQAVNAANRGPRVAPVKGYAISYTAGRSRPYRARRTGLNKGQVGYFATAELAEQACLNDLGSLSTTQGHS